MRTDDQGYYAFEDVDLGEYVLTVEAAGHAPLHRHIKVDASSRDEVFALKPGRVVRGRVVDAADKAIGGACVELDQWHCHTDPRGYFHCSVAGPAPDQVTLEVYKKYDSPYEAVKTAIAVAQLGCQPLVRKER